MADICDQDFYLAIIQDVLRFPGFYLGIEDEKNSPGFQDSKQRHNRFEGRIQVNGRPILSAHSLLNQGVRKTVGGLFDFKVGCSFVLTDYGHFIRKFFCAFLQKLIN